MLTRTGAYLAEQRRVQHLNSHQLAAALGYTNLVKGGRRILALERDGTTVYGLVDKVINALGLDREFVRALVDEDRRRFEEDWQHWASEPVAPKLRCKVMPAIWVGERLPEHVSRDDAIAFARARAIQQQMLYLLIWSRKEEILCRPDGRTSVRTMDVGQIPGPFLRLRGRGGKQAFYFG
jgi:hypothetical protein